MDDELLLENGDALLLENGDAVLLESDEEGGGGSTGAGLLQSKLLERTSLVG